MHDSLIELSKQLEKTKYVYHYTSFDTLFALLNSIHENNGNKCFTFWASNIYTQNDPCEMQKGYTIIKRILPQFEEEQGIAIERRLSEVYTDKKHEEDCKKYLIDKDRKVISLGIVPYTISFSKCQDFLPMWSMYGDKGNGVCLKIKTDLLLEHISSSNVFGPVTYNGKTNMWAVQQAMELMYILYLTRVSKRPTIEEKIHELGTICLAASPFVKNKDYRYEKEFRIVFFHPYADFSLQIKRPYEEPRFDVKPHVDVKISIECLMEIIIGPNANYKVMSDVMGKLLKDYGLAPKIIRQSSIKYIANKTY